MGKKKKDELDQDVPDEVENSQEPEETKKDGKTYILRLKHNCSHELHLAGKVAYRFEPNEIKEVPESVINHKDFTKEESKNYVIKEKV